MRPTLSAVLLETVRLVADGCTNVEIAHRCHVSEHTVRSRIGALKRTLRARDRAHAVAVAYRMGILDAGDQRASGHLPAIDVPIERLVEARLALGLDQARMAELLGAPSRWLSRRETGLVPFTVGLARRYAELVGVDLDAADGAA